MDPDAIERLSAAVNRAFAEAERRDRARSLALADMTARAAALKARRRVLEDPVLFARMQARGPGLSARVWC